MLVPCSLFSQASFSSLLYHNLSWYLSLDRQGRFLPDTLFRLSDNVDEHHDEAEHTWEMVPANGGEVAGAGLIFLLLNDDSRIRPDYQF
jgi:hypothetical protein